jgi:GDPmannose 4,6-dehydratase
MYAHWITINYREAYGLYAANGILFNHESPRRGATFVSRKITRGLSRVHVGIEDCIYLGNLNARRDWGHARDYVEAQWLMLQQPAPGDFVVATGRQNSVRECVQVAGRCLGMQIEFRGDGHDEQGIDIKTGRVVVRIDPRYFRPAEVDSLLGDAAKARDVLGWTPKVSFDALIAEMVDADLKLAERDATLVRHGYAIETNQG